MVDDIKKLFAQGHFSEILDKYLGKAKEIKPSNDLNKRQKNVITLFYVLEACMRYGVYCDYLEVLRKYDQVSPLRRMELKIDTLMTITNVAFESLLYCLYNNKVEGLGIEYDIPAQIEKVIQFQNELIQKDVSYQDDQRRAELLALYEDYKQGKMPVYVVEYLYPFEPIVPDYVFDISSCYPYITLEVKKEPRDTDSYTWFKFKVHGLIRPDTWWMGPKWETREKMPPVKKTLEMANMMLLQAVKASPGKMVLPYSINQVSTVAMHQYRWDEKEPILGGTIIGTDFTADWVGGNAQWHQFTDVEMRGLNESIVRIYGGAPFVTTFHHATNLLSAGFNLEAFSLLCSCCEGMVYHWLGEIAKKNHIADEYDAFKQAEISRCDTCQFFTGKEEEKPFKGMAPSIFSNVKFVREKGCIAKSEEKRIKKLISQVRNEQLRNKTAHGENSMVSKEVAQASLSGIFELQELLVKIANKTVKSSEM